MEWGGGMSNTERANGGCVQRLVRRRLTAKDWDDAADLFEQGAVQAEEASPTTHTTAAAKYAVERMNSLAMFATRKSVEMRTRERMESPNEKAEPLPPDGDGGAQKGQSK